MCIGCQGSKLHPGSLTHHFHRRRQMLRFSCPRCNFHDVREECRCPHCLTTWNSSDLEELARLDYLQARLSEWHTHGVLAARDAQCALMRVRDERVSVVERLATGPAP